MRQWVWWVLLVAAWLCLTVGIVVAATRELFDPGLSRALGIAGSVLSVGGAALAWLGVRGSLGGRVRGLLRNLLAHWAGAGAVVVLLALAGVGLIVPSLGRQRVLFECRPADLVLLVDGRAFACGHHGWTRAGVAVQARAGGFFSLAGTLGAAPFAPDEAGHVVVELQPWRCSIEGPVPDGGLPQPCGRERFGRWARSLTWRVRLETGDRKLPVGATLLLDARPGKSAGVALQAEKESRCFPDGSTQKEPGSARLELDDGCVGDARAMNVYATVCDVADEGPAPPLADLASLRVMPPEIGDKGDVPEPIALDCAQR